MHRPAPRSRSQTYQTSAELPVLAGSIRMARAPNLPPRDKGASRRVYST